LRRKRRAADTGLGDAVLASLDGLGWLASPSTPRGAARAARAAAGQSAGESGEGAWGGAALERLYPDGWQQQPAPDQRDRRTDRGGGDRPGPGCGGEFLGSLMKKLREGASFEGLWRRRDGGTPEDRRRPAGTSPYETAHGMGLPVEHLSAVRERAAGAGPSRPADHQRRLGELFAPFTAVAAANPDAGSAPRGRPRSW